MDVRNGLVIDLCSLSEEVIDGAIDHFLVAWHGSRRKNDRISWLNAYQAVILVSDTRQGRGGFTLATRTDNDHLRSRKLVDILRSNEYIFRNVQVAKFNGHLHVIDHAPSHQRDMSIIAHGGIDHLLHTRQKRSKSSQQNATRGISKNLVERVVDNSLRRGKARRLHAGTIAHHHQHAFVADAAQ